MVYKKCINYTQKICETCIKLKFLFKICEINLIFIHLKILLICAFKVEIVLKNVNSLTKTIYCQPTNCVWKIEF